MLHPPPRCRGLHTRSQPAERASPTEPLPVEQVRDDRRHAAPSGSSPSGCAPCALHTSPPRNDSPPRSAPAPSAKLPAPHVHGEHVLADLARVARAPRLGEVLLERAARPREPSGRGSGMPDNGRSVSRSLPLSRSRATASSGHASIRSRADGTCTRTGWSPLRPRAAVSIAPPRRVTRTRARARSRYRARR